MNFDSEYNLSVTLFSLSRDDLDIVYSQRPYVTLDYFCTHRDTLTVIPATMHDDLPDGLSIAAAERFVIIAWNSKHATPWNGVGSYGSDQDIFVSWSTDYGASFSHINNALKDSLTDGTIDDRNPGLVFAGYENSTAVFILGWHTESNPTSPDTYQVYAMRLTNTTCARESPICLNRTGFALGKEVQINSGNPSFLATNYDALGFASNGAGYVIIVWADSSVPASQICISSSSNFGRTWSAPSRISSTSIYLQNTRVALSNGIVVVTSFGMDSRSTEIADLDVYTWRAVANFSTPA